MKVTKLNNNCELHELASGTKFWYQNGKLHKKDEPAVEFMNGSKVWYQNGKRHRVDGPAVDYADGRKFWYIKGKQCSRFYFTLREFFGLNK